MGFRIKNKLKQATLTYYSIENEKKDSRWSKWAIKKIHFSTLYLPSRRKAFFLTGLSVICLSEPHCFDLRKEFGKRMVCLASQERGSPSWF
jgi:hypothetical protein